MTDADVYKNQWRELEEMSKGAAGNVGRHISSKENENHKGPGRYCRFLEDERLEPVLKRMMIKWGIYKFPVKYEATQVEVVQLNNINNTHTLGTEDYEDLIETVRTIFNAEQQHWENSRWKLQSSYVRSIQTRLNKVTPQN